MAVELKLPQLGESVHEGTIGKWLKQEGESVEQHEPVLEVITDKVDTEVTASEGGTLLRILVPEGETVAVGTVLAVIGEAGEAVAEAAGAPTSEPASEPGAAKASPVAVRVAAEHGVDVDEVAGTGRDGKVTRQDVERHVSDPPADSTDLGFISPRVARLAAENGIDLRLVSGTGRDGRITARDVERFATARQAADEKSPPEPEVAGPRTARTPPESAAATGAPSETAEPATPAREAQPLATSAPSAMPAPAFGEIIELTPMRQAIAEHMVRSKHTSPHVSTVHEVDMGAVVAARAALKDQFAERGLRLTFTAFIVQAAAQALAEHPILNSSWSEVGVEIHPEINIGLAVALDKGLIVPVIRNADSKSLMGLARDVTDLSERARTKQLTPDDVQGGTFTITNYGTLGSLFGTPIINQPQVAILGTGAIKKRVVVVDSADGETIAIRPMMFLSLTFDHRVLDGGLADPFVQTIVHKLETYQP